MRGRPPSLRYRESLRCSDDRATTLSAPLAKSDPYLSRSHSNPQEEISTRLFAQVVRRGPCTQRPSRPRLRSTEPGNYRQSTRLQRNWSSARAQTDLTTPIWIPLAPLQPNDGREGEQVLELTAV